MARERVVIDPVTRIEGHLRMEMEAADGVIKDAWSEVTQFKGVEIVAKDRDPRDVWAFTQRICGVCTAVHAVASLYAVEDALQYKIPSQARLIRDLVIGTQIIQDHVIHFYHLQALDWVSVPSAATADPAKALAFADSIGSTWAGNSVGRFTEVKETLQGVLESGQDTIFTNGYWNHPDYRLPAEANLMAVSHYLDALEFQRSMIRVNTVFGGKNPHPNFLVGGMASPVDLDSPTAVNGVTIDKIESWLKEIVTFVRTAYLPDALAILGAYPDWFGIGASSPNYFAVGAAGAAYPGLPNAGNKLLSDPAPLNATMSAGVLLDGNLRDVMPFDPAQIAEYVSSAWYTYSEGDAAGLHPSAGETNPDYKGPELPWSWVASSPKYTWSKAPRYEGRVMQVGPVARVLLAYAQGEPATVELVDGALSKLQIKLEQLNSTAGRMVCRAIEAATLSDRLLNDVFGAFMANVRAGRTEVFNPLLWEPSTWPSSASGYSLCEVARGNLSHWCTIESGKIDRYQCVVPTTWLGGGRDPSGQLGPYEYALAHGGAHPLVDPSQPLEPLRTLHSFDPCMSCGVHVLDPDGGELFRTVVA